jgi:hypothetical protein
MCSPLLVEISPYLRHHPLTLTITVNRRAARCDNGIGDSLLSVRTDHPALGHRKKGARGAPPAKRNLCPGSLPSCSSQHSPLAPDESHPSAAHQGGWALAVLLSYTFPMGALCLLSDAFVRWKQSHTQGTLRLASFRRTELPCRRLPSKGLQPIAQRAERKTRWFVSRKPPKQMPRN